MNFCNIVRMYVLRGDAPEDVAVWTSKLHDCIWQQQQQKAQTVRRQSIMSSDHEGGRGAGVAIGYGVCYD